MRWLAGSVGVVCVTLAGGPHLDPVRVRAQDPSLTFHATANSVALEVSVRRGGRPVAGLTARDFEILDNGVRQDTADVSYEQLPIDVTIALDVSASVTGSVLGQLRRSVQQLKTDLAARDRLKLMAFNMRVHTLADFAEPSSPIPAAFDAIRAQGSSAIFDTLAVALTTPAPPERRQLIVVLTDGEDSSSVTSPVVLLDVARRTTATVALVVAGKIAPAGRPIAPRELAFEQIFRQLAAVTGGAVITVAQGDDLTATFRRVLNDFRSSYVLHFIPHGVQPGGVHTLIVRVSQPGPFDIRSRSSYVWR